MFKNPESGNVTMESNSPTPVYSWRLAEHLPVSVRTEEKMKTHLINTLLAEVRRNAP